MPILPYLEHSPELGPDVTLADDAYVLGRARVAGPARLESSAVVRADQNRVTIGARFRMGRRSTIHVERHTPTLVGADVWLGDDAVVHATTLGDGTRVEGRRLIEALARESHRNVALIGGGEMLHALLLDRALDRLYLTLACRMVGGASFDTLLTGAALERAAGFQLEALHYDAGTPEGPGVEQLFAIFDRHDPPNAARSRRVR